MILRGWLDEAIPERKVLLSERLLRSKVEFSIEMKRTAVADFVSRAGSAQETADKYGVTRAALYKWKNDLLGKEYTMKKSKRVQKDPSEDLEALSGEVDYLKVQVAGLKDEIN